MVNETEITEVRIRLATRDAGNIVAWASCLLCGGLILNNIEILRGRDGNSWINFPSRPSRRGKAMHFFYPVNHRTRAVFEKAILDAYASQAGISRAGSSEKRKG